MSHRTILALSAALTAFVLVLAGAAASIALRSSPAQTAPVAQAPDTVPADVVRAREAEYRRIIDEANARLARPSDVAAAPAAEPPRVTSSRDRERHEHEHEHANRVAGDRHERDERHGDDDG